MHGWSRIKGTLLLVCSLIFMSPMNIFAADSKWHFTTKEQIISIGDIHGDFNSFVAIMQKAALLDEANNWIGGKRHFVSTGDYLDRGPDSRKVMDLLMKLEKQAADAGGKLHVLLGNHEVMNMIGDRRYVSLGEYASYENEESSSYRLKRYQKYLAFYGNEDNPINQASFNQLHPPGYFGLHQAFKHNGQYGSWLQTKPFIVVINQQLFTHGGLSKTVGELGIEGINEDLIKEMKDYSKLWYAFIEKGFFLPSFNMTDRVDLGNALLDGKINREKFLEKRFLRKVKRFLSLAKGVLSKNESPIWYRGTALCHQYSEEPVLDKVLARFDATSAYLGHSVTTSREVESRFDKKVFLQDTGLNYAAYRGQASLVYHNKDSIQVFDARHGLHDITPQPPRQWFRPYGMTTEQLEEFLLTAEVTASKDIGIGITKPLKLTLTKGNKTIHAMYKSVDTFPFLERKSNWPKQGNDADRYQNELAAYELNKILKLDIIPPTVARSYKGKKGIFQFWVNNAINRSSMIEDKISYEGSCSRQSQRDLMKIFDALIFNADRNTGNVLYQMDEWQIWLIDHTRSFHVSSKLPKPLKWSNLKLSNSFRKELEKLTRHTLSKSLKKYLHKKQISNILMRRDNILERVKTL